MTLSVAVKGLVLAVLLAWQARQLVRRPRDPVVWTILATLALLAVELMVNVVSTATHSVVWLFVQNVALVGTSFSLVSLYLVTAFDLATAARHAWWHAVPAVVAVLVMAVGMALSPPRVTITDMNALGVALLQTAVNAYMAVAAAAVLRGLRRYARRAERRLRVGLRVMYAGLALMSSASALFAAVNMLHWAGETSVSTNLTQIGIVLIFPGIFLFLGGLLYPATAQRASALRVWRRHWRDHAHLDPLWRLFHQYFPHDRMERSRPGRWDHVSPLSVHRRYYRRAVECRDGLVRVSPWLVATGADMTLPTLSQIRAALDAYRQGRDRPTPAVAIALPQGQTLDDDVAAMIKIARTV